MTKKNKLKKETNDSLKALQSIIFNDYNATAEQEAKHFSDVPDCFKHTYYYELNFLLIYYILHYFTHGNVCRIQRLFGINDITEYNVLENQHNIAFILKKYGFPDKYFGLHSSSLLVGTPTIMRALLKYVQENCSKEKHRLLLNAVYYDLDVNASESTYDYLMLLLSCYRLLYNLRLEDESTLINLLEKFDNMDLSVLDDKRKALLKIYTSSLLQL